MRRSFDRKNYFFAVIVFLIFDIAAGKIYSSIKIRNFQRYAKAEAVVYGVPSPFYHHDMNPNVRTTAQWGPRRYSIITNSLGFRDKEVRDVALESRRKRIVLMGDSFTFGPGVEFENTFAGILEKEFQKQNIEVLNAAVASYSPIIYWLKTKHLLEVKKLKFETLIVFLDISDIQDEADYSYSETLHVFRKKGESVIDTGPKDFRVFLKFNSVTYRLCSIVKSALFNAPYEEMIHRDRALWTVDPKLLDAYGRDGVENALGHMDRLWELCRQHGIALTIAVYPWPDQVYARDLDSKQVQIWSRWAREHGTEFINFFPAFIDERPAGEVIQKYFIAKDVHWNEEGHHKIVEYFLESYVQSH